MQSARAGGGAMPKSHGDTEKGSRPFVRTSAWTMRGRGGTGQPGQAT